MYFIFLEFPVYLKLNSPDPSAAAQVNQDFIAPLNYYYTVSWVVSQGSNKKVLDFMAQALVQPVKMSLLASLHECHIIEASHGSVAEMPSVTYCTKEPTTRTLHPCAISATYRSTHLQTGMGGFAEKSTPEIWKKNPKQKQQQKKKPFCFYF